MTDHESETGGGAGWSDDTAQTPPTPQAPVGPPTAPTPSAPAPPVQPAAAPAAPASPPPPPWPLPPAMPPGAYGQQPPAEPAASPYGGGYGAPPVMPPPAYWASSAAPLPPPHPPPRPHATRNAILASAGALIALAGGILIGHAAWTSANPSTPSASGSNGSSGSNRPGYSYGGPGNGFPYFGNGSSGSGSSGSGSSGNSSSSGGPSDVSAIAAKVDPGLVDINTNLGYEGDQAAGTGMVLTPSGEVLTNNHVIEGATTISVTDVGNGKTYSASVVGYDRTHDVAVLQLHGASGLQTADIGSTYATAKVGEQVVAVGNAGGTGGTPSAAGGTITALNQSITASDEGDGSSEQLTNLIESNADIVPGDSGGALVDTAGQVLGIDTAASSGFVFESGGNQGYTIPISEAMSIAKEIEAGTTTSSVHIGATGFLGVLVQDSGSQSAGSGSGGYGSYFGQSSPQGAGVVEVITSSPAQEAGIAQGDVITAVNGQTVGSASDLTDALEPHHPGDSVKITWIDGSGQSHTATVTLTSGPPQ
ncbi:MAG TPA: trypsin-like peptidase domain-containing protein [Acidimicrobiales bacterium]|nr:trypsin-like peptidase domain-containing protein [Acidimicrobiales bacterium]